MKSWRAPAGKTIWYTSFCVSLDTGRQGWIICQLTANQVRLCCRSAKLSTKHHLMSCLTPISILDLVGFLSQVSSEGFHHNAPPPLQGPPATVESDTSVAFSRFRSRDNLHIHFSLLPNTDYNTKQLQSTHPTVHPQESHRLQRPSGSSQVQCAVPRAHARLVLKFKC